MTASAYFSLSDLKTAQPITGWQEFLEDGQAFLQTAAAAHAKNRKAFSPEILYNIIAMAIEKFVMAALMRHGALPYNHTMQDLVEAMEETFPNACDFKEDLLRMDRYQEICDLDAFKITPPAMTEIPFMLVVGNKLRDLVVDQLV